MTECVDQGLSADSINLMLDGFVKRLRLASNRDPKVEVGLDLEFLPHARQDQSQIGWAGIGRAQAFKRFPALLNPFLHKLKNSIQPRFELRIRRYVLHGHT